MNQNSLVAQSEEMRSVLTGLMGQLEVVAREEQTVKTRKKGQDKERDTLASQMERLLKVSLSCFFYYTSFFIFSSCFVLFPFPMPFALPHHNTTGEKRDREETREGHEGAREDEEEP